MARKGGMAAGVTVARINVKVSPDTDEFRRKLKEELEEIEKTMKGHVEIKADLDGAQAKADFERLKAAMNKGGRVKVGVDLDIKDGADGKDSDPIKKLTDKLGKKKGGFFDAIGGFPSFGTGVNPAGYAVIAALLLDVIAPAVGIVSTGLLALPGLFTAIIAPIGAVALGMNGIKEAAEASGLFKPKQKGVKGSKAGAGAALDEIKAAVNETFKVGLVPAFDAVANILQNDTFVNGIKGVAQGVNDIAISAAKAASTGPGLKYLNDAMSDIGTAMSKAAPGWADFTTGMLGLIQQLTSKLPDLSGWFNDTMSDFKNWIAEMDASGELKSAFEGLGASLKIVVDAIGKLGEKGIQFMSDPKNIQAFLTQLQAISDLLGKIMDASAGFNRFLDRLAPAGRMIAGIANALTSTEGDKSFSDQAVSQKIFGGLGYNFEQQMKAAFGDEGAKKYLDKFYADAEAGSAKTGETIGINLTKNLDNGPQPNAQRMRRGFDPVAPPTDSIKSPETAVEPPDTTKAIAAINAYKNEATTAIEGIKKALSDVSEVQPPNLDGFAAAFDGIPDVARGAMQTVVDEITIGGTAAAGAATGAGNAIVTALNGMQAQFQTVGFQMMNGVATGISEGKSLAIGAAVNAATEALAAAKAALGIKSPSRKFMEVGQYSMEGMAVGMENGIGPVLEQAKGLASKVADAFSGGGDPTAQLDGFNDKEVNRMEKVLTFESKRLGLQAKALEYKAKLEKNDGLKAQAEELRNQQDQINMQKDMLDLTQQYSDLQNPDKKAKSGNVFLDAINELMTIPNALGGATLQQGMSDLGIGGNGALEAVAGFGMDFAKKGVTNIFNTSNVEDTLSAHFGVTQRQSQGIVGR